MNIEKRNKYKLNGSYHTLEIKSKEVTPDTEMPKNVIKTYLNKDKTLATSKINPNKLNGDVFAFSEFVNIFDYILCKNGINDYRLTRADMRFDNYDPNYYLAFAKLNKYIISALALTYSVKNKYRALELFSDNQISIAIKNDYFECENYDRQYKSEITGNKTEIATSRFEERTTTKEWRTINKGNFYPSDWNLQMLKKEFTHGWDERWKKARKNLKLVQNTYNDELVKKYNESKNSYPVQYRSLTDFLIANQNSIFTSMQMIDLLKRLGVENAENRAKYHKKTYGIEYFSQKDVDFAIREIKRATNEFFSC